MVIGICTHIQSYIHTDFRVKLLSRRRTNMGETWKINGSRVRKEAEENANVGVE